MQLINKYENNSQSQDISKTGLKEFIPVVDEDVARLLKRGGLLVAEDTLFL